MNVDVPRVRPALFERITMVGLLLIGAATTAAGVMLAPERLWASWLMVAYYTLGVGLAGLCLVAIHYTTGASWSVAVRRVAEALAGTLPFAAILVAIVFAVRPQLYPWTSGFSTSESDGALAFKQSWLSRPFFLWRAAVYVVLWVGFASAIRSRSRRQDVDGDTRWTRQNVRLSAAFLVIFAVTFTLASVDWVMSLEPLWYSTIFGFYNFAGVLLSGLAALILTVLWLERSGPLRGVLTDEHLHDLGKLLFALSSFWMYIWFSQYMLIWYANVPEETVYFVRRLHGLWLPLLLASLAFNWVAPFLLLLRRDAKRHRAILAAAAGAVLVGRWLDLYLMIFPSVVGEIPRPGLWELGMTAGAAGCFGLILVWILGRSPVVPVGDPQLGESLRYRQ